MGKVLYIVGFGLLVSAAGLQAADIALYRFDADGKTAGQTADTVNDSIGSYSGAATNGPTYQGTVPHVCPLVPITVSTIVPNKTLHGGLSNGLSLQLSRASSQYISVPDAVGLRMGSGRTFTVEGWVKLATLPSLTAGRQWLVHKSQGADAMTDYGVLVGGADLVSDPTWYNVQSPDPHVFTGTELVLVFGNGSAMQTAVSNLQIPDDSNWHHVMVSYNAAKHEVVFLVDYVPELLRNVTPGNSAGTGSLIIGGHSTGSGADETFDGQIDEVRIADHALPGSPESVGIPSNLLTKVPTWWWNIEGAFAGGAFNPDGRVTWRFRRDRFTDDTNPGGFWDVIDIGSGGNALKFVDVSNVVSGKYNYPMFDTTTGGARNDVVPDGRSRGATLVVRFKINSYHNDGTDLKRCMKWIRLDTVLKDGGNGTRLFWEVGHTDVPNGGKVGISLFRNEEDPRIRITGDLTGTGWHVLHAVAYVDPTLPPGTSHMITWLDGQQIDEWTTAGILPAGDGAYIGVNDNGRVLQMDWELDYARFSPDAAWKPDGTLIQPTEGALGLCDNGIDDDGVNGKDCADSSCSAAGACKCYPHVPWADQDDDGDVDMSDFGVFQACFTGLGTFTLDRPCTCLDRDDDGNVDADDLKAFNICVSGPALPAPDCP